MTLPEALIVATVLLTGSAPPALDAAALPDSDFRTLRFAVVGLAVDWEILDPREAPQVLLRREHFAEDVNMLRQRYQELADAPRVADAYRFPDRKTIDEFLAFNRAYRQHVEFQHLELERYPELYAAQSEAYELYQLWSTLRAARTEYYYVTVRRRALKHLRELLGDEAYYRGELPPHVPLWRFQELR